MLDVALSRVDSSDYSPLSGIGAIFTTVMRRYAVQVSNDNALHGYQWLVSNDRAFSQSTTRRNWNESAQCIVHFTGFTSMHTLKRNGGLSERQDCANGQKQQNDWQNIVLPFLHLHGMIPGLDYIYEASHFAFKFWDHKILQSKLMWFQHILLGTQTHRLLALPRYYEYLIVAWHHSPQLYSACVSQRVIPKINVFGTHESFLRPVHLVIILVASFPSNQSNNHVYEFWRPENCRRMLQCLPQVFLKRFPVKFDDSRQWTSRNISTQLRSLYDDEIFYFSLLHLRTWN